MTEWNHTATGLEHYDLLPDDEITKKQKERNEQERITRLNQEDTKRH